MTNGPELRKYRRDRDVSVVGVARLMRRSRATVHKYEGEFVVDPDVAEAYKAAVDALVAAKGKQ